MRHLSYDEISGIALKVADGMELTAEEAKGMSHFPECPQCEKWFGFCLSMLDFMKPESLEDYFMENFREEAEEAASEKTVKETVKKAGEELQAGVLYKIRFLADQMTEKIRCAVDYCAELLPEFEMADSFAYARGWDEEDTVELEAGASLIRYEREEQTLRVSMDADEFGTRTIYAVLRNGEETEEKLLEDDGHGMMEAVFEDLDSEEFTLTIVEAD